FRMLYAFGENFMLPLSHDEVVHGKGSLIAKMPGDEWQKFANLRLLFGWMYAQPGKKLLFMGGEFGQWREWDVEQSLDWHLLDQPSHGGLRLWVGDLGRALAGDAEQRRAAVRRERAGQHGRRRRRASSAARPLPQRHPDPAAAGGGVLQTRASARRTCATRKSGRCLRSAAVKRSNRNP